MMSEDNNKSFFASEQFLRIVFCLAILILGIMIGYLWGHRDGFHFGCDLTELVYKSCGKE